MKKSIAFLIVQAVFFSFMFTSCGDKPERIVISQGEVPLSDTEEDISPETVQTQTWQQGTKCFAIIFGYDFNSEEFVEKTTAALEKKYGLYSEEGLVLPLVYPDDFKNGSKPNISLLKSKLTGKDLAGMLILGAPDGTGNAISRITDSFGKDAPYPVFSCFSQDDILSIEYNSNIVIDKAIKADLDGMLKTEEEQTIISDIQTLIENSIELALNIGAPVEKNADLIEYAKKICSPHKVTRYTDPDTTLNSLNHFYLQ